MPVTTSQQITRYFEQFSDVEVTFTKEVTRAIMLNPKQVYIKCLGYQWPCIIHSASMTTAKIIANLQASLNDTLKKANNLISLRFSFLEPDKPDPLSFYVPSRVIGFTPYQQGKTGLYFANLQFTQRPPDDLIQVLGQLLDANVNAKRRTEDRVPLTAHSVKSLGLEVQDCGIQIDGVPRKSIFRDLSFSGCKAVILGLPKMMLNRRATVRLIFNEPEESYQIPGQVCRFDPVEGREDIAAFGIRFDEDKVPMSYKLRINSALKTIRADR